MTQPTRTSGASGLALNATSVASSTTVSVANNEWIFAWVFAHQYGGPGLPTVVTFGGNAMTLVSAVPLGTFTHGEEHTIAIYSYRNTSGSTQNLTVTASFAATVVKLRLNTEVIGGLRVSDQLRVTPIIQSTNNGNFTVNATIDSLGDDLIIAALAYGYGQAASTIPLAGQAWIEIDENEASSYYSGLYAKFASGNTVALEVLKQYDFGHRLILLSLATATPNVPVLGSTTLIVVGGGTGVSVDNEVTLRVKALSTTAQDFAGATLSVEGEVAGLDITPATAIANGSGEAFFTARGTTPSAQSLVGRGVDGATTVNSSALTFYVFNGIGGSSDILVPSVTSASSNFFFLV